MSLDESLQHMPEAMASIKLVQFRFDNCRLDLVAKQIACREYVSQNYVAAPASEHYYLRVAI